MRESGRSGGFGAAGGSACGWGGPHAHRRARVSPFQRVALACDFTSPLANSGPNGLAYINVDITLYLHRLPVTEWVGFDVTDHGSAEGVCVGECRLYDEQGPIGQSLVAGLAQRRRGR